MRFSEYMKEWLYGEDGYYSKFITIGKKGDFYTAVSSSMFFGGSIANYLIKVIDEGFLSKSTTVVEIGAHKGYLMADIIQFLYTLRPSLLETLSFMIVEPMEENIKKQQEYFKDSFANVVKVEFVKDLDEIKREEAFVVANELFDAFICEVIKDNQMLYIEDDRVYFGEMSKDIKNICDKYGFDRGEVGLGYGVFAKKMARAFDRYEFVTFDYGEDTQRRDFSLRIYYKHNTYPFFALTDFVKDEQEKPNITLKELYKNSDITYDVNFDYLSKEYLKSGAKRVWYATQASTLVKFGIIDLLEILAKNTDEKVYKSELNRVKILLNPTFMGERFKGIIFRKE